MQFASVTLAGVFAGFLITVLVLELSMRDASGVVYTQVRHVELIALDVLATAILVPAIAATATVTVMRYRAGGSGRRLMASALLLMVLVVAVTVLVNLPINADQHGWVVTAPPPDWADIRDRWQLAHALRTAAAVIALGCLAIGTSTSTTDSAPTVRRDTRARCRAWP
ncbi:anthrone oxygenase family protein [Nocardia wallacei]|uniref:anthrone oxygenase family protein n=1 Tax=Nocardia wallacei TaxID=480035 RepID=UPI00245659C8|nr:anthrone oxygenase family protein [Nocardia wallacei]